MATYDEVIARIADDFDRTDLDTQIGEGVNRALARYAGMRTWFNTTEGTFNTVASQAAYDSTDGVPTDIEILDLVKCQYSGSDFVLRPATFEQYQQVQLRATTHIGLPRDWAWYQEKLYLYPTPNDAYPVTLFYVKKYAPLSTGVSNDWTTEPEALELIESYATRWAATRLLKDYEVAAAAQAAELEAIRRINEKTNRIMQRAQIKPFF